MKPIEHVLVDRYDYFFHLMRGFFILIPSRWIR